MGWFKDFLESPAIKFEWEIDDDEKPIVHNHYHVLVDNRVIQVSKEDFKRITEGKKIEYDKKLIEVKR